MKVASLDLGTNTFILLIAEVSNGKVQAVLHDEVRVIRLGQGIHESRRLHPEALQRADACFAHFATVIAAHGVTRVLANATSAARDAVNSGELIELGRRHGIPIEIISGQREAELTFLGTIEGEMGPVRIIDVGGGSTEIISGDKQKLLNRVSVDIGSVRLTEKFVKAHPVADDEMQRLRTFIDKELSASPAALARVQESCKVIAVAGTPTTLATLEQGLAFESHRVHGFVLTTERLRFWTQRLAGLTVGQRQELAGMEPKRADVIVAGAMILLGCAEMLGAPKFIVSVKGLRYGIAQELGGVACA